MKCLLATLSLVTLLFGSSVASANPAPSGSKGTQSSVETTSRVTVRGTEQREFDWAKSQARAQVAGVSSGPKTLSGRMIDNDLRTVFRFSPSDSSPTVIVELAQAERIHRISAVFKAEQATLDVFLLDKLPKDVRDLGAAQPFASVSDTKGNPGWASVDFSPNSARYVAFRWKRFKSNDPFEVAEISAFSNEPTDWAFENPSVADAGTSSGSLVTNPPPIVPVSP